MSSSRPLIQPSEELAVYLSRHRRTVIGRTAASAAAAQGPSLCINLGVQAAGGERPKWMGIVAAIPKNKAARLPAPGFGAADPHGVPYTGKPLPAFDWMYPPLPPFPLDLVAPEPPSVISSTISKQQAAPEIKFPWQWRAAVDAGLLTKNRCATWWTERHAP